MKAILLCGGYGTRLFPITLRTPKVLLPVAGKPVIQHQIEELRKAGIKEAIVSLNKNQERIQEFLGNGEKIGIEIKYNYEESKSDSDKPGAIGAIAQVVSRQGIDDYLVIGSDNFFQGIDLTKFIEFHERKKALATVALFKTDNKYVIEKNSAVALDSTQKMIQYQEKPRLEYAVSNLVGAALHIWGKEFTKKYLPEYIKERKSRGQNVDMLGHIWQHYAGKLEIYGYEFTGLWGDVGTCETYLEISRSALNLLPENNSLFKEGVMIGKQVKISPKAEVEKGAVIKGPSIIEDNCRIRKDAVVGPYVHLMHGTEVGERALVEESIVFENVRIGKNTHVVSSILDGSASIEENSRIESYSMIGYKTHVGSLCRILSRSVIWPGISIKQDSMLEGQVHSSLEHLEKELSKSCFWKKEQ